MTRGIPSLEYLKMLSTAILDYNEKWRALDEQKFELPDKDEEKRAEAWYAIIELAEEIHDCVVVSKKKGKKHASDDTDTSSDPGTSTGSSSDLDGGKRVS